MCLGVLGKVAALIWPGLGTALSFLFLPAHTLSPKPAVFAEFHLDYLVQTFQPKMEQTGEYQAMQRAIWARMDRCMTSVRPGA
jgi:hypothetical protein